jgi:hypothetical protein
MSECGTYYEGGQRTRGDGMREKGSVRDGQRVHTLVRYLDPKLGVSLIPAIVYAVHASKMSRCGTESEGRHKERVVEDGAGRRERTSHQSSKGLVSRFKTPFPHVIVCTATSPFTLAEMYTVLVVHTRQ